MNIDKKPTEEELREWHSDPNNWKLGIFYFNPKDKRIFPPKRISGLGWTVNFANPVSVLTILAILAITFYVTSLLQK
jgi:uncharacterized membrane protein